MKIMDELNKTTERNQAEIAIIEDFHAKMKNRMAMGCYRYGALADKIVTYGLRNLKRRIELYEQTHNIEYLIDAANLAMIEFIYPSFNDAKFESIDDGEHCK